MRDLSAIRVSDDEARLELRQNGGCPLQNSEAGSREAAQSRHLRSAKVLRAASQPSRQRRYWQAPPARRRSRSDRAAARIRSPTSCTILWNSASRTISAPCGSALMRLVSSGIKSAGSKKSKEPKKVAQSGLSLSGSAFLERALRLRGIAALRGRRLGLGDLRLGAIAIGCDEPGSVHGRGVIFGGIGGGKTCRSGSGGGVVTAAGGLGWSCSTSRRPEDHDDRGQTATE